MKLEQAVELARRFHDGAIDKAGRPYIEHVLRVADAVGTHEEKLAAVMHDLLEDTLLTSTDLSCAGCPPMVRLAIEELTRSPGEDYVNFLRRAARNPLAHNVKIADVKDNADEGRLALLEPDEATRLRQKYSAALQILNEPIIENPAKSEREYHAEFATIGLPETEPEAWLTFWCSACGRPAGTLSLVIDKEFDEPNHSGGRLLSQSFLGSCGAILQSNELDTVREQLVAGDATPFLHRDSELTPFWCYFCTRTYCASHWYLEPIDGDIFGTCPLDHRRRLWD